jgi:signal peptide peptidase SppA
MLSNLLAGDRDLILDKEQPTPTSVEIFAEENGTSKSTSGKVAVIPIQGELMKNDELCEPAGMATIGNWIKEADSDSEVDAILLHIDSPGGTVDGTETLGNIVKNTKKPTVAFVDGLMASAALWIGSNSDRIIASTPNDKVGSIGVMISFADMQPFWEQEGIKFHTINADQSSDKNKVIADALAGDYKSIKAEMLNPLADAFIQQIRNNRPNVADNQLTGKMFFAKDVIGSLVDEIADFDGAIRSALNLVNNYDSNINEKSLAMSGQNIDEKTFMQKVAETFGLKPVEKQKADEAETLRADVLAKADEITRLRAELQETREQNVTAQTELAKANAERETLTAEIERLAALPGAQSIETITETDGKGKADAHVVDDSKGFEANYEAVGKAFGFDV